MSAIAGRHENWSADMPVMQVRPGRPVHVARCAPLRELAKLGNNARRSFEYVPPSATRRSVGSRVRRCLYDIAGPGSFPESDVMTP